MFNYQLDRHCSKTGSYIVRSMPEFNYQLDRHCSKTVMTNDKTKPLFNYQLDRHCSKTIGANSLLRRDVQSNRPFLSML